ncbi:MAG: nitrilase-related carbon-nitrogen hydrolase [Phycisphaerales bacterium]|jgi:predicted amidohydrolase|nr:nitrilase-related carbon-nitrogen hydrolase [Phycisphaerales bacterium]
MRIHCIQYDIAWEDKQASHATAEALIATADVRQGDLIVLPELGDVGFSLALDRIVDDQSAAWATSLAADLQCWVLHGWPERREAAGRNVAGLASPDGTLVGTAEKLHPYTAGQEQRAYQGGEAATVFEIDGVSFCPLICYDLRFPESFRAASAAGAEVFAVIANWPSGRGHHWRTLSMARAIENQAAVIACNRTGRDPHREYGGGSLIVDHQGIILAEGGAAPEVVTSEIDVDAIRAWRASFPALADVRVEPPARRIAPR